MRTAAPRTPRLGQLAGFHVYAGILRGAKPADLPVLLPTHSSAAQMLGLTVPLLARADALPRSSNEATRVHALQRSGLKCRLHCSPAQTR
jgi:hypothetical protein